MLPAILMNVNNGEILSLVSLPDFDPNKREDISDAIYTNRATLKEFMNLDLFLRLFSLMATVKN